MESQPTKSHAVTWPLRFVIGLALDPMIVQQLLARLWFRHFHYGPLEWVWRSLARLTRRVPFRRRGAVPG